MANGKVYVARPTDRAIRLAGSAKGMRIATRVGRAGMVQSTVRRYSPRPLGILGRTIRSLVLRKRQLGGVSRRR